MAVLKVLVDIQALGVSNAKGRGPGVGSVALTNALLRFAPDYEIFLLRRDDGHNWQIGVIHTGVADVQAVWNDPACWFSSDPAEFMEGAGIDILYVTCPLIFGFEVPPTPPGVLVASQVHDMVPVVMASQYLNQWPAHLQADYQRQLQFLRDADLLIGSSRSTANDLTAHLRARGMVRVAYLCTPAPFTPMDPLLARHLVARDLGLTRPYVLAITEADPRKNTPRLIEGFAAAGLPDHQLVVAGIFSDAGRGTVTRLAVQRGVSGRVVTLGFVPRDLLNALYCAAKLFVFPSLYEGFGLPSLEAMQCGVPVVAGNNSCFPEVVGNGGMLVDTSSPLALARAIQAVANNPRLRQELGLRGMQQAALFSYQRTASEIKAAFSELAPQ